MEVAKLVNVLAQTLSTQKQDVYHESITAASYCLEYQKVNSKEIASARMNSPYPGLTAMLLVALELWLDFLPPDL